MCEIDLLITITDRASMEEYIEIACDHGVPMALGVLGRGTATDEVLDMLGLESCEKAVMFDLVPNPRAKEIIRDIKKRMFIDLPGTGIVLTVPVSSIAGSQMLQHIVEEHEMKSEKEEKMKEPQYELIVAIANEGHTDVIMDAAREAGAGGGTVVHAKGTASERARKFFGMSLASEKEMVFIVARAKEKSAIMKAIVNKAGMHTDSKTVVLSLPVSMIEGLQQLDDESDN